MWNTSRTNNRIQNLIKVLSHNLRPIIPNNVRAYFSSDTVAIGGVVKEVQEAKHPENVPRGYYREDLQQTTLHHLRWMLQKDALGQDIFLLGPPGPRKRRLAMTYLQMTNREHEYVALSRDTTESDLKQRREIVGGTARYFDQSAVRAATEGRVLVLEGIEKAERNVLPVLNNLLENREMHLEDGRLLIPANRYDDLLQEHGEEELLKWKLVRVDENFRVIALGLPVPKYRGNPLDPPLRSRFQARDVHLNSYQEWYTELVNQSEQAPQDKIEQILSSAFALILNKDSQIALPDFPVDNLPIAAQLLGNNPNLSSYEVFYRLYPYKTFLADGIDNIEQLLSNLHLEKPGHERNFIKVPSKDNFVQTDYQSKLITEILETTKVADVCLVGPSGCGKTLLVDKVSELLGNEPETIVLYQDMTARDLIQHRTTLENGDTVWRLSPLVQAALDGKVAVLDGINRIHPSTLSVVHRLVHDRELQLHDGQRLISHDRYDFLVNHLNLSEAQLLKAGVFKIDPKFRIIALGESPKLNSPTGNWMSPELLSLFVFHEVRMLSKQEEMHIISSLFGPISRDLHRIIDLAHVLRSSQDASLRELSGHLSTRQLLRIAARMKHFPSCPVRTIEEAFMIKFLPSITRQLLLRLIKETNLVRWKNDEEDIKAFTNNGSLTIGKTSMALSTSPNEGKVPNIVFYDVPQHLRIMEKLMQDIALSQAVLLVGNQGVGKNKIIDRFLELLNRPREYLQLHRDTTVQTLTSQPTIKDGRLVYEDSPLVRAIQLGRVLVVDEADKAPTHVTCILKSLVESGTMILSDGRRIVRKKHTENQIEIHPDFRIVVLANRPGFPFLGNDFFGALGDLFSCYAVENPTKQAEIDLLKNYAPNVDEKIIERLVNVFGDLRQMADQGLVSYPYSTREVVNIVKHLEKFPNADLEDVVLNVFDFDRYSPEVVESLGEVLERHGFAAKGNVFVAEYAAAKRAKEQLQVTVNRYSGLDTSAPKHGKEDEKNEPHVGGNTWAGGTGGRDTAGLGGKGGPYRLDKGHTVHQLSDEEKNAVPDHVQKAAREMNRKAFQDKLKEIGMSAYDSDLYNQFSKSIQRQAQSLRVILSNLQAKNKERQWTRNQTSGELDDVKLIDGLLGEKTVFRRRQEELPEPGTPQLKPKLFRVVADVSGSMYRFNGYDGRLDRELEAAVLVMEAFEGFEDRIKYDIFGHSGDTHNIVFVTRDKPPKNNKERLEVLRTMHAHSQFCWSGDHTLESTEWAVNSLAEEECDEAILIILSDANLQRYGIPPSKLAQILTSQAQVSAYAVFIGSLGDQAARLTEQLPAGRSFICKDTKELPQILKQIFSSSVINS